MVGDDMNVYYFDINNPLVMQEDITACIGYFDGLHVGHQKLIQKVLWHAKKDASTPALITFEPDPWQLIRHVEHIAHITPMQQRMRIGASFGIRTWIILQFDEAMQKLAIDEFHERVLRPMRLKTLVCGYDFHYAQYGVGDTASLRKQSYFALDVVEEVASDHKKISSSRIEELLADGSIEKANQFLGRYFTLTGTIKKGKQLGRLHGFPTANLQLHDDYIIPRHGVYVGSVRVDGVWVAAIINIGHNPTYNYQKETAIEAHLLNFDQNLYGKEVIFRFASFLRPEKKFARIEELIQQLQRDRQKGYAYIQDRRERLLCD